MQRFPVNTCPCVYGKSVYEYMYMNTFIAAPLISIAQSGVFVTVNELTLL